jgi:hypothetical protein
MPDQEVTDILKIIEAMGQRAQDGTLTAAEMERLERIRDYGLRGGELLGQFMEHASA